MTLDIAVAVEFLSRDATMRSIIESVGECRIGKKQQPPPTAT